MLVDAAAGQRAGPSNGNRRANYYSFFLSCDKQEKQECSREGCVFFRYTAVRYDAEAAWAEQRGK